MTENKQSIEKKRSEVERFVRKYINNEKNLDLFISHLSPYDLTQILKKCLKKGMTFTWESEK